MSNQNPNTKKDEPDLKSPLALLLEEAYQLGYHKIKDGCLIPLALKSQRYITSETKKANKELFKALRGIWSNPPKEYVEQGSNELYWNRTSLLKILDTLEAEWENLNA